MMLATLLILCVIPTSLYATLYDRSDEKLTEMPSLPEGTTELDLSVNNITIATTSALRGKPIARMLLNHNQFSSFPDLEVVGATLETIDIAFNQLTVIPHELIDDLILLKVLDMRGNLFTTFPNLVPVGSTLLSLNLNNNLLEFVGYIDVEGLDVITELHLRHNPLGAMPNLSALVDTLTTVDVPDLVANQSVDVGQWFREMGFQGLRQIELSDLGLLEFPDLAASCGTVKSIHADSNNLSFIDPSSIEHCASVTELLISTNQFQQFPNVSVMANSLRYLKASDNHLTDISTALLYPLVELRNINLAANALQNFPDLSNSRHLRVLLLYSNNISEINETLLSPLTKLEKLSLNDNSLRNIQDISMPSLRDLRLSGNNFQSFPAMQHLGQHLRTLYLKWNKGIRSISKRDLIGLEALGTLELSGTSLHTLPDFHQLKALRSLTLSTRSAPTPLRRASAYAMYGLRKLTKLHLQNTDLVLLPNACPERVVSIHLEGNDRMQLCDSRMAWLKLPSVSLSLSDVSCRGQQWSNLSYADVQMANPPRPGSFTGILVDKTEGLTMCSWHGEAAVLSYSWDQCRSRCLTTWGCTGFNYDEAGGRCRVISPTVHPDVLMDTPILNMTEVMGDTSAWTYYASMTSP